MPLWQRDVVLDRRRHGQWAGRGESGASRLTSCVRGHDGRRSTLWRRDSCDLTQFQHSF